METLFWWLLVLLGPAAFTGQLINIFYRHWADRKYRKGNNHEA